MRQSTRTLVRRLGVALLIYLVALEVALQVVAVIAHHTIGREAGRTWVTGNLRILCLGDSNTFGLYLRSNRGKDSYPAQLETLWNGSGQRPPIEVLNLGIPGMNSSAIRRDLPDVLQRLVPDFVIVMVGANDFWTEPAAAEPPQNAIYEALDWVTRHSRVHRLYLLLRSRLEPREEEVERQRISRTPRRDKRRHPVPDGGEDEALRPPIALPANLHAIADASAESGAQLLLMTYPTNYTLYGAANRLIRKVAASGDIPLIDLTAAFRPVCPRSNCPELLYKDRHPNARGYALIAETIVAHLKQSRVLASSGVR